MSLDPVADFESLLKKNEFLFMVCKSSRPPSPISIAYGSSCGYRGSWCLETLVSAVAEKGGAVVTVTSETADMLPKTLLEGSDKLARDAFVHSGKVFTSLVLFNASIISHNSGAPTDITVGAP